MRAAGLALITVGTILAVPGIFIALVGELFFARSA